MPRSYDINEIEERVTALDNAKRRSYDIYDIEQRVYDLEQGGTPGPTPTPTEAIVFQHFYTDELTGTITFTRDARVYITTGVSVTDGNYGFKVNNESITTEISTNMIGTASGFNFSYFDVEEGDVLTWTLSNANRYFSAVGV